MNSPNSMPYPGQIVHQSELETGAEYLLVSPRDADMMQFTLQGITAGPDSITPGSMMISSQYGEGVVELSTVNIPPQKTAINNHIPEAYVRRFPDEAGLIELAGLLERGRG